MLLAKPAQRIAKKWAENVWENEFVIRRKLKNMDDESSSTKVDGGAEAANENGARSEEHGGTHGNVNLGRDGGMEAFPAGNGFLQ